MGDWTGASVCFLPSSSSSSSSLSSVLPHSDLFMQDPAYLSLTFCGAGRLGQGSPPGRPGAGLGLGVSWVWSGSQLLTVSFWCPPGSRRGSLLPGRKGQHPSQPTDLAMLPQSNRQDGTLPGTPIGPQELSLSLPGIWLPSLMCSWSM